MKPDFAAQNAARKRQIENRGLTQALMVRLQIPEGFFLAPLLGQSPTMNNLEAVQRWLDAWRSNHAADCLDLDLAARSLRADIEGSLQ